MLKKIMVHKFYNAILPRDLNCFSYKDLKLAKDLAVDVSVIPTLQGFL